LTGEGLAAWPLFLQNLLRLAPQLEAEFPDALKSPEAINHRGAKRLAQRARDLKDRVKKKVVPS